MDCRPACAACCIAPSISSAIPGMPGGKPAGVRCVQLTETGACRLFGQASRPAVCVSLRPQLDLCGTSAADAWQRLTRLETDTLPAQTAPAPDTHAAPRLPATAPAEPA